jgi:hypothetical protein
MSTIPSGMVKNGSALALRILQASLRDMFLNMADCDILRNRIGSGFNFTFSVFKLHNNEGSLTLNKSGTKERI